MAIWQQWFGKSEQPETIPEDKHDMHAARQEEGQLKVELRQLMQQRQSIEQRGCFSDRELEAKDRELEDLDRRIKSVKTQQFKLRTQMKLQL